VRAWGGIDDPREGLSPMPRLAPVITMVCTTGPQIIVRRVSLAMRETIPP